MFITTFNWFDYLAVLFIFVALSPKKNLSNLVIDDEEQRKLVSIFIGVIGFLLYVILFKARHTRNGSMTSVFTYAIPISIAYALLSPGVIFEYSKLMGDDTSSSDDVSFKDLFTHTMLMIVVMVIIHNINRCISGPQGSCSPQYKLPFGWGM